MRIRNIKRILVIMLIIVMLQTQIISLTNVVWALTAEVKEGSLGPQFGENVVNETVVEEMPEVVPEGENGITAEVPETVPEVPDETPEVVPEEIPEETLSEETVETPEVVPDEPEEKPEETVEEETEVTPEEPEETPKEDSEEVPEEKVEEPKIELNIGSENASIYKGYLYANATSDLRYETRYDTVEEVTIVGSKEGITGLKVTESEDKIRMVTDTKLALFNNIYYKKARVSVEEFKEILGEEGIINILDADGDFVGYIDTKSQVEDGDYVYEFVYYTNSVTYELSNPVADGTIRIRNEKAIKEDSLYSREQVATFNTINVMSKAEMMVGEEILSVEKEGDIKLEETESKIAIELDKTELSTEEENDLTIVLTLKTDAEKYELFKNPVMEIEMPSNINEVSIEGINLLYRNGLSLRNWEVVENDKGNKVIRVELDGAQSVYTPGVAQEGTTVILYSKVNVNRLTSNTSEALKLRYTNEGTERQAYVLEGKEAEEIVLKFVAKHGMLKGIEAINNRTKEEVEGYEEEVDKVEVKSEVTDQTVTIKGTVINNFEMDAEEVVIVGRIPFVGNKNGKGEDLQSSFDTILNSEVLTSGNITEIFYSENGEAEKDDETWSQDVTDMSKYKSFKIVVKEGTLKNGERLEFTYDVKVPDNLGYNLKSYATYTVIYKIDKQELTGNSTIALVTEEKELEADDLENKEEVAKLEIGTQVSQGGRVLTEEDTVYERQILRYTVVVINPTKMPITNIKLTGRAENANMYTWKYYETENYYGHDVYVTRKYEEDTDGTRSQDEMIIDVLNPGESKTFEYQVITKDLPEEIENVEDIAVYGIVNVSADNITEQQIETMRNKVIDGEIELIISYSGTEEPGGKDTFSAGEFPFNVFVKNISETTLANVKVNVMIPDCIEIDIDNSLDVYNPKKYEFTSQNLDSGTLISFVIPELSSEESDTLYFSAHANSMEITQEVNIAKIISFVERNDKKFYSNDYIKNIYQGETKVEYNWEADCQKEIVEDGEIINFEFTIKNIGIIDAGILSMNIDVPSGLKIQNVLGMLNNDEASVIFKTEETGEKHIFGDIYLDKGNEYVLRVEGKIDSNAFMRDQQSVDMQVKVFGGCIESFETDVISYKINNKNVTFREPENIEPDKPVEEKPIEPDEPVEEKPIEPDEPVEEKPVEPDKPVEEKPTEPDEPTEEKPTEPDDNKDNTNTQTPDKPIEGETVEQTKPAKTYVISGKVWLDKNKDGINQNESGVESVVVLLYKTTEKGTITTQVKEDITNKNGEYIFTGVEEGTYVVIFMYDTGLYNSTKYKVSTATTSENSDAITKAITIDGMSAVLGITDVITIKESGAINVDLGLVNKNEFDFALEKYIEKAVVTNESGTKTYNYEEKESVKLEIHSKQFKNSRIDITYKIRVRNAGEVAGYINRIADYVPEGMKFDNNKNPEWYYGDDGSLYYKGLIGKEISPGETREISLVLTKTLEEGEAIKIVNGAEIVESTNSMGLTDIDSIVGNKNKKEDDYGEVSLMITISTGNAISNIFLVILAVATVVIIVYISKFKTIKKVYR